jgi:paraquat-inducible protein B
MSKKANPTIIGLFFSIGLALAVTGLLIFSTRSAFHPRIMHILYFDGSLKGLNPGAPVKFRGVTVGSVVDILIRHNQATNDHSMPVIISIDKKLIQSKSDEELQFTDSRLKQLISVGYRGRLEAESLVTGVLYVELGIVPRAPPPQFHQIAPEYDEIPTIPTEVQQLLDNLAHFDIPGLSEKLNALLARLDSSLAELNVAQINAGVTNLLANATRVVASPDLTNSLAALKATLTDAQTLLKRIDSRVDSIADGATNTLHDAQTSLADLRAAIQNFSGLIGPDSAVPSSLRDALVELSNASRSIAELAAFLERNPNSLIAGKKRPKEHP